MAKQTFSEEEILEFLKPGEAIYVSHNGDPSKFQKFGEPIKMDWRGKKLLNTRGAGAHSRHGDKVLCYVKWYPIDRVAKTV